MKTLLKKYVCLWLSLSVLLGSVGLSVSEHICLISGKVMLSHTQKEDPCCKKRTLAESALAHKSELKSKCCTFKTDQHKLEIATQVKLTQFSFVWISAAPAFFQHFGTVLSTSQNQVLHYADSSPPLYGKRLLYSLHTLRV